MKNMISPKINKRSNIFLCWGNLFAAIFFILISVVSCEGCGNSGNKSNKGGYVPNVKGNIACIKVDETELIEPKRDFTLQFTVENNQEKVNLSNYRLHVMVIDGEVSYDFFCLEDNGKKKKGQTSAFSLGIPLFFEKVEFTPEEITSGKVNIPFNIIPKPGTNSTTVVIELIEKTEKGEKSKETVTLYWRKEAF